MIVLINCLIFDGVSPELRESSIVIEDGIIREIGKSSSVSPSADIIDLRGRFVMPGLIDAHFHSYWYEYFEKVKITPPLKALQAKLSLEGALRRGFTTVRDAGGGDVHLALALRAGLIDGPRFFYPMQALSQTGGHGEGRLPEESAVSICNAMIAGGCLGSMSMLVDGPDEMRKIVREFLRQGATHIKLHVSGGLRPNDPIWMNQFTDEEISAAVEEATAHRAYVAAHSTTNESTLRCLKNGVRSIEHATTLDADGVRAIVKHQAFVVPTLGFTLAMRDGFKRAGREMPRPMSDNAEKVANDSRLSLDLLRQAGAQIGFGTDMAGGAQHAWQLREFGIRSEVCKPIEILRSATSVNAEIVQMKGKLGTVAVGAYADLLAIDGNPLEDILIMEKQERYAMIMRDGKIVKSNLSREF